MGDYSSATSLFSNTLTSQKPSATTSNSSNVSVNITTSTMQDDLLIEKQTTGKPAPLSPSGALDTVAGQDKSKDVIEAEGIAITPTTPSATEKDITCSTTSLQGFADPGGRVPSLWSAPDDGGLHTALPVNGSIAAFQNFPTGGASLLHQPGQIPSEHLVSRQGQHIPAPASADLRGDRCRGEGPAAAAAVPAGSYDG